MDYIISILPQMWLGTIETLKLFFITIVLSIPLGILLALARVSSLGSLRSAVGVYVWLLRGTPLMLQLLFVYYGLPFIPGIGIRMDDFQAAIFAFVLNYAAYFCEIFRAGIQSFRERESGTTPIIPLAFVGDADMAARHIAATKAYVKLETLPYVQHKRELCGVRVDVFHGFDKVIPCAWRFQFGVIVDGYKVIVV